MTEPSPPEELPLTLKWGQRLMKLFFGFFLLTFAISRTILARLEGVDFTVLEQVFVVLFWSLGTVATTVLLIGWVRHPEVEPGTPFELNDERFGWLTKVVISLGGIVVWGMVFLSYFTEEDTMPLWQQQLILYVTTVYCWSLVYLLLLYSKGRHIATSTYLNHFYVVIGILLMPVTWPLLIWCNLVVARKYRTPTQKGEPAA